VEPEVYAVLLELSKNPWQPIVTLGWHDCDLCQYEVTARSCANVFVPGREVIYVCPELTTHYINAHGYMPPKEFCQGRACLSSNGFQGIPLCHPLERRTPAPPREPAGAIPQGVSTTKPFASSV